MPSRHAPLSPSRRRFLAACAAVGASGLAPLAALADACDTRLASWIPPDEFLAQLPHIMRAFAVPGVGKALQPFVTDFGLLLGGREDVEEARTTAAFLPLPATNIAPA